MGWNGSGDKKYRVIKLNQQNPNIASKSDRSKWMIPSIVLAVAVIGIAIWVAMTTSSNEKPVSDAPRTSKKIIKESPVVHVERHDEKPISAPESREKMKVLPPKPSFMDEKPRSEWTSAEMAMAYQWYALDPDNRVKGVDMTTRIPPPVFSNVVQECMAPYLIPGADVVPMGPITDEQAREAINTPIDFGFDDPDELLNKKQGVKEMLAELKDYMDKGGHARDYFLKLESRQALESDGMQIVREKVREMERAGDYEGAVEALTVFNNYLEEKGLPKVHMRIRQKGYVNE